MPVGAVRGGNGPTIGRGNLNGDDIHVGRRQRRTRSSRSESQGSGAEEDWVFGSPMEGPTSFGQSPGLQGEQVWYNRRAPEQAESAPQRRNGNPASSSPRNQGRGSRTLTFRSRRPQQHQGPSDEEQHPNSYSQSPGTEGSKRPAQGRGRARSFSSEPHEGRGRGYRGARRRGLSETEGRPRRDKYGTPLVALREWERHV